MSDEGMQAALVKEAWTIATFSVPSIRGIRVECDLHHVRSSSVERICSHTMRPLRDADAPTRRVGHHAENRFTVWIAKQPADGGKVKFLLESTGCLAENTWHSGRYHDELGLTHACVLIAGDVTEGVQEEDLSILFAGGDTMPFVGASDGALPASRRPNPVRPNKRMTPRQFAEQNKGAFMLVTLRWYITDSDVE